MQPFTLNQAAKACNKSKSTLLAAISGGRLSAKRDNKNQWQIDPAELFRVYESRTPEPVTEHQNRTPENYPNTDLIEALRAQIELLKDQVSQEREHSAHWRNQATMLLTHQPEPSKPQDSRLWLKLFGRK